MAYAPNVASCGAGLFPTPPPHSDNLLLRPWRPDDAAAIAGWRHDAEIVRWTEVPSDYSEGAARTYLQSMEDERLAGLGSP
jgi:RimJ/RimL family protein N-acetyltransferase